MTDALAPLLTGFEYRDQDEICAPALPGWRALAGTRRGRLHAHHGTHREDAFHHGGDVEGGRFWDFLRLRWRGVQPPEPRGRGDHLPPRRERTFPRVP